MQRAIVAIGGGHIRLRETVPIDREIIRLSGKKNPKILFIPTASSDQDDYCAEFHKYFVARKLAVLLHKLWVSGEVYEPLRNSREGMAAVAQEVGFNSRAQPPRSGDCD